MSFAYFAQCQLNLDGELPMQPYQQRIIQEKEDLDQKIAALAGWLRKDNPPPSVPRDEVGRMINQLSFMEGYSRVLGERIAAFVL